MAIRDAAEGAITERMGYRETNGVFSPPGVVSSRRSEWVVDGEEGIVGRNFDGLMDRWAYAI